MMSEATRPDGYPEDLWERADTSTREWAAQNWHWYKTEFLQDLPVLRAEEARKAAAAAAATPPVVEAVEAMAEAMALPPLEMPQPPPWAPEASTVVAESPSQEAAWEMLDPEATPALVEAIPATYEIDPEATTTVMDMPTTTFVDHEGVTIVPAVQLADAEPSLDTEWDHPEARELPEVSIEGASPSMEGDGPLPSELAVQTWAAEVEAQAQGAQFEQVGGPTWSVPDDLPVEDQAGRIITHMQITHASLDANGGITLAGVVETAPATVDLQQVGARQEGVTWADEPEPVAVPEPAAVDPYDPYASRVAGEWELHDPDGRLARMTLPDVHGAIAVALVYPDGSWSIPAVSVYGMEATGRAPTQQAGQVVVDAILDAEGWTLLGGAAEVVVPEETPEPERALETFPPASPNEAPTIELADPLAPLPEPEPTSVMTHDEFRSFMGGAPSPNALVEGCEVLDGYLHVTVPTGERLALPLFDRGGRSVVGHFAGAPTGTNAMGVGCVLVLRGEAFLVANAAVNVGITYVDDVLGVTGNLGVIHGYDEVTDAVLGARVEAA